LLVWNSFSVGSQKYLRGIALSISTAHDRILFEKMWCTE
jgi:hypothetical protein